jgi:small basic protein
MPPPRAVPLSLKLSLIFGNPFMIMSWFIPGFVFCGIAAHLNKFGFRWEPGISGGLAGVWIATWVFFLGIMIGVALKLAGWILSDKVRLLEHGMLGQAVLQSKTEIKLTRKGGPLYHLRFEYEVNGKKFHTWMDTSFVQRLLDEPTEPILYDPEKPGNSTLLDELPAHIEFDEAGSLGHRFAFMGYAYACTPLAVIGGMLYMTVK